MNENHNEKETNMILDLNKLHTAIMDEFSNYKFSSYVFTSKKKLKMFTDMVKPFIGTNEYFEFVDFEIRKNGKDNMDCVMRFNIDSNRKHEVEVVSLFFNFKPEIECGLELRSVDFYCMSPFYGDDTDEGSAYIVDKNGKLILSEKRSSELSNKSLRIINFIKDSVEFKNLMKKCIYNRYIANPIISYEAKYATLEMDDNDLKEYETYETSAKNMFDNEKQIIGEYSNVEDAKKSY